MIHERIAAAKAEIEQLKYLISDEKNRLLFQGPDIDSNVQKTLRDDVHPSLKAKLGGRGERIYAVDWCSGSSDVLERLVSVGQEPFLHVWNTNTGQKLHSIPLDYSGVMACSTEKAFGSLVAVGGQGNTCSIYSIKTKTNHAIPVATQNPLKRDETSPPTQLDPDSPTLSPPASNPELSRQSSYFDISKSIINRIFPASDTLPPLASRHPRLSNPALISPAPEGYHGPHHDIDLESSFPPPNPYRPHANAPPGLRPSHAASGYSDLAHTPDAGVLDPATPGAGAAPRSPLPLPGSRSDGLSEESGSWASIDPAGLSGRFGSTAGSAHGGGSGGGSGGPEGAGVPYAASNKRTSAIISSYMSELPSWSEAEGGATIGANATQSNPEGSSFATSHSQFQTVGSNHAIPQPHTAVQMQTPTTQQTHLHSQTSFRSQAATDLSSTSHPWPATLPPTPPVTGYRPIDLAQVVLGLHVGPSAESSEEPPKRKFPGLVVDTRKPRFSLSRRRSQTPSPSLTSSDTPVSVASATQSVGEQISTESASSPILTQDSRATFTSASASSSTAKAKTKAHVASLVGHDGYITSIAFANPNFVATASSDSSCFVWDIEHGKPIYRFLEHEGDVLSIDVQSQAPYTFLSSDSDGTCILWDIRCRNSVSKYSLKSFALSRDEEEYSSTFRMRHSSRAGSRLNILFQHPFNPALGHLAKPMSHPFPYRLAPSRSWRPSDPTPPRVPPAELFPPTHLSSSRNSLPTYLYGMTATSPFPSGRNSSPGKYGQNPPRYSLHSRASRPYLDVNVAKFMPHSHVFACGNDSGEVLLFDSRTPIPLAIFRTPLDHSVRSTSPLSSLSNQPIGAAVTALDFSMSGRVIIAGYENGACIGWNVLHPHTTDPPLPELWPSNHAQGLVLRAELHPMAYVTRNQTIESPVVFSLPASSQPISSLKMRCDGRRLATASLSENIHIWDW